MVSNTTPQYPPVVPQHQHALQWYGREVVRGLAAAVHSKVNNISRNSSFLKTTEPIRPCLFDLCELGLGPILGAGAFSEVHSISHVHLRRDHEGCGNNHSPSMYHRKLLLAQQVSGHGRAPYVVKLLRPDLVGNDLESAAIDMCIEAQFLTRLNHPNIVKVMGLAREGTAAFDQRKDGFFIIMDRLEPLDHRIQRWRDRLYRFPDYGQVSLSRKMNYASKIADAMSYLHDLRIIFRDLKPSNVGFQADDTVQIFDFGLSRELPQGSSRGEDETFLMSGVGTRRYMAPEIINSNCYNLKADCFSWAMLVVEMLTLNKPYPQYSAEQHTEFVCKHGERPVLTQFGVPPVLQRLLEQSWAHDVRLRFSMKDICNQLESLSAYSDEELSQMTTRDATTSFHSVQTAHALSPTPTETSPVYFEFPPHFQHLVQDCEILSEYSDMESSCMDLTLTTTASTTWQDSVATFF